MKTVEMYLKEHNIFQAWDIGFGSGEVTRLLASQCNLVVAVDINSALSIPFPNNVVPLIGSIQSLLKAYTYPVIDLAYVDIGNNEETCRYILQQLKGKAKTVILRDYPWLTTLLINNESVVECTPLLDHMEVRWMS